MPTKLCSKSVAVLTPTQLLDELYPLSYGTLNGPEYLIGQFSLPAAQRKTMPLPLRPPVWASCVILLITLDAKLDSGEEPHELDSTSTLSAIKLNTVINLLSDIYKDGPEDCHFTGNSLQPGAAPTVRAPSVSAATTPQQQVP